MFKNISKKKSVVILVIVLVVVLVASLFMKKMFENKNQYSVVYLTTGEVYIGKLSTFPSLELKDGYILQVIKDSVDPNKNNFQLNPLKDSIWAPQELHLIGKNVVFYGKLSSDSKIAQTIAQQIK